MIPQCAFCEKIITFTGCRTYPAGIPKDIQRNETPCEHREAKK